VSVDDILAAQRREQEAKQTKEKIVSTALKDRGLNVSSELTTDEF
jgi:hypothetical protein